MSPSMNRNLTRRLDDLDRCKHLYGRGCAAKVEQLLQSVRDTHFPDAQSLVRFHDTVLFLRAVPQSARIAKLADSLLAGIGQEVQRLRDIGADLSLFDDEEFSGVA